MTVVPTFVWNERTFVRAWEAGVFDEQRVELVAGEVLPVCIGWWQGQVGCNLAHLLWAEGWRVTMQSLPAAGSLPDPDAWVMRRGSAPVAWLGETRKLTRPNPADVGLVVEVDDASFVVDMCVKTKIYAAAMYPVYWVVHRRGVEIFTDPSEDGYREQRTVPADGRVTLPYAPIEIAVADILDAAE